MSYTDGLYKGLKSSLGTPLCTWDMPRKGLAFHDLLGQRGRHPRLSEGTASSGPDCQGFAALTEILMILSNMTSGETWKSKTKYCREKDQAAVTGGSPILEVPVCAPATPPHLKVQMSTGSWPFQF